jgi:hypothetical protein
VAAVIAVVVVTALVLTRPGDDPAQPPLTVGPSEPTGAEVAVDDDDDPLGTSRPAPSEAMRRTVEVDGAGPLVPSAPEVQIVAADFVSRLQLIDLATGDIEALEVFSGGRRTRPDGLQRVGDAMVLDVGGDVVRVDEERRSPIMVARGHRSIPTSDDASVWVYDGQPMVSGGTASRVDFDGEIRQRVDLPAVAQPLAGTAEGLLVRTPGTVSLIAADGERTRVAPGQGLVSDGRRLAWLDCTQDLRCFVVTGTVDDPDQVRVELDSEDLPVGLEAIGGAFSPDGRWLALPLIRRERNFAADDHDIAIIDLTLGAQAQRVEGSPLVSPTPVAWSDDSRWLAISSGSGIRLWSARTNQVAALDVRLWPTYALTAR